MKHLLTRTALLIAVVVGAALVFAGGLTVMNIRADWALALGGLLCLAAPVLCVAFGARLLMEGRSR